MQHTYPSERAPQLADAVSELLGAAGKLRDAPDAAEEVFLVVQDVRPNGGLYPRDVRGHALIRRCSAVVEGERGGEGQP